MPLKKRDIIASLERKGFQIHESDHRYLYFYWSNGKKTSIKTKISHGSGNEIDDNLVHLMATQCYGMHLYFGLVQLMLLGIKEFFNYISSSVNQVCLILESHFTQSVS